MTIKYISSGYSNSNRYCCIRTCCQTSMHSCLFTCKAEGSIVFTRFHCAYPTKIHCSLRSFQPFLHSSRHRVPILYNVPSICLLKISPLHGRSGPPHQIQWFHNPNSMSIGSAVFAGFTTVTDRPTDRPTNHATPSVTLGCIYVVLRCGLMAAAAAATLLLTSRRSISSLCSSSWRLRSCSSTARR